MVEAPEVRERRLLHHAAIDKLGERNQRHKCSNRVTVASRTLGAERAAWRDQWLGRTPADCSGKSSASTPLVVDDELVGWERICERHVAKQIALAEGSAYAVALVVLGPPPLFRSSDIGAPAYRRGPGRLRRLRLLGRVAERVTTPALAPGVHDGALIGRRQLLEHLSAQPLAAS